MSDVKRHVVNELHKQARINFKRRHVSTRSLDETFQTDLVEMIPYAKENGGFRYLLVCIDIFSKYLWVEGVKNKTGLDVSKAMQKIFNTDNRIPKNMQTDMGKEFYNKDFKKLMDKYNIHHYSSYSTKKASIVERVNRTLKNLMWKEFSFQGSYKWRGKLLRDLVYKYNTTKHRTINMKPIDVTKRNEKEILKERYNFIKTVDKISKYQVGDDVRISKYRTQFTKGYTPNYSNEIFKISQVHLTNPITYTLVDYTGSPIKGKFYSEELLKVKYPDIYLVERVLKRRGDMVFVRWLGMDSTHDSWIHKSNVY